MTYSVIKIWNHSTVLQKVCYVLLIIVLLIILSKWLRISKEGFKSTSSKEFIINKKNDVFDDFYVSVYDDLMHNYGKNSFEIGEITEIEKPTDKSTLLDVGSGTGHHVAAFSQKGIKATGVDISKAMVDKAKENYPDSEFIQGDVMDTMLFTSNTFSHITCLYFTIYYFEDKRRFFSNCMEWLMPGGFLILHLVDREKFDPIIPAAKPIYVVSPQKYADKRITNSVVKFDKFDYKCNFDLNGDVATISETFKDKENDSVRQNEHKLYMEPQKVILSMAKEAGFILHSKVDMISCQYENQYLYILQKPN
jgi:SAM-dependent methyltransferase